MKRTVYVICVLWLLVVRSTYAQDFGTNLETPVLEAQWNGGVTCTDSWWYCHDSTGAVISTGGGTYPKPDWVRTRTYNESAAVQASGGSMKISLTWSNPNGVDLPCTLSVTDPFFRRMSSTQPDQAITAVLSTTSITLPANGSGSFDITFSGCPNVVCWGQAWCTLHMRYVDTGNIVDAGGTADWVDIYFTDSAPAGQQLVPWIDLLAKTCTWADGLAGQPAVSHAITLGMFNSASWVYDPYLDPPNYYIEGTRTYRLKKALSGLGPPQMDCRDVSGFLSLAMQSQGANAGCTRLWNAADAYPRSVILGFRTNPVDPIGGGGYQRFDFSFHQVASSGLNVWDGAAAQSVNLSGAAYAKPPMNWPQLGYWQTPSGQTTPAFYGLVFGLGYSTTPAPVVPASATYDVAGYPQFTNS